MERRVPDAARAAVVWPVRLDPFGVDGPNRHQARSKHWRRTSHGLYLPSNLRADTPEQRIVEAASCLPSYGGITGWAALRWLGGVFFDGRTDDGHSQRPVVLATGAKNVRAQPGVVVSHEGLEPGHLVHEGLPLTHAARSVAFEMRHAASLESAVSALDMAAYSDLVSIDEAAAYVGQLGTWTGVPQARRAIVLANESTWSPMETRLRLVWMLDAGLPAPLCNRPVFDSDGRHVATPDLLDPTVGLAVEYDGRLHLAGGQRRRDLRREDRMREVGLELLVVLGTDLLDQRRAAARLVAARERARRNPRRQTWSIDYPPWWRPTDSVRQRRAWTRSRGRAGSA